MTPNAFLNTIDDLKSLGLVASDRDCARLLGTHLQFVPGLRCRGVSPERLIRQSVVMRLQRRLHDWKERSARPVAERLDRLIKQVEKADERARFLKR